jgi:hypothetical protein
MKVTVAVSVTLLCDSYGDLYRWCKGYGDPRPVILIDDGESTRRYAHTIFFFSTTDREIWLEKQGIANSDFCTRYSVFQSPNLTFHLSDLPVNRDLPKPIEDPE